MPPLLKQFLVPAAGKGFALPGFDAGRWRLEHCDSGGVLGVPQGKSVHFTFQNLEA